MSRYITIIVTSLIATSLIIIGVLVFMMWNESKYRFTYFYSHDKEKVVTLVDHEGNTYIVGGFYETKKIPAHYIRPIYSGRDGFFMILVDWNKNKTSILSCYGRFETKTNDRFFNHQRIPEKMFYELKKDSLNYTFIYR